MRHESIPIGAPYGKSDASWPERKRQAAFNIRKGINAIWHAAFTDVVSSQSALQLPWLASRNGPIFGLTA